MSLLQPDVELASSRGVEALRDVLDHSLDRRCLRDLLLHALDGATTGGDVPEAYLHPNGFIKLKLLASPTGNWAVRIHLWDRPVSGGDIHTHRWSFASKILLGSLVECEYESVANGTGWRSSICRHFNDGPYQMQALEPCGLKKITESVYSTGSSYIRHWATFHDIKPNSAFPVISAVIQGPPQIASTTLIRPVGTLQFEEVGVKMMDSLAIRDLLRQILNSLSLS